MSCENYEKSCLRCIKAFDTNRTLKATFKFLENNQNGKDGLFYETLLYLGISILESQDLNNYKNRKQAFNLIYGKIVKVRDSYLVIETVSPCENEKQEYTVAFSDIANVRSQVFDVYFNEYIEYMSKLPSVCSYCGNKYYDLLEALKREIKTDSLNSKLNLIYSGNFSLSYSKSDYTIVKNLILIEKSGLIPITSVEGFFTVINEKTGAEKISIVNEKEAPLDKKEGI